MEGLAASFQGRAVVLVRNPYNALVALWNFKQTQSHTSVANRSTYDTEQFQRFITSQSTHWLKIIENWVKHGKDLHFIAYEDLCDEPVGELRKILKYLHLQKQEDRLTCIKEHLEGNFKRSGNKILDPFTEQHHMVMKTVGTRLPLEKYEFYTTS